MINTRKIYLYTKESSNDILTFLQIYEEFTIKRINDNLIEITIINGFDLDTLIKARDFVMVELYQDFTAFVCPSHFTFKISDILDILPELNKGIYTIENLIYELVMDNNLFLVKKLKNYYYSQFNAETIETIIGFIEQNLNATKTAKVLYMHRNTLNYRLDNFIRKTEIDVRTFKGALAMYLLFKR